MKERGILFTGPNVLKCKDGTKRQTRRIVSCIPDHAAVREITNVGHRVSDGRLEWIVRGPGGVALPIIPSGKHSVRAELHCPYGSPGDRLWVRENFRLRADQDSKPPSEDWWKKGAWYEADGPHTPSGCPGGAGKLRPAIHMPRWASRLTLEIARVRVERLQEISEEDAIAEGVKLGMTDAPPAYPPRRTEHQYKVRETPVQAFARSWNGLHGAGAWEANQWVWAIDFRRLEG